MTADIVDLAARLSERIDRQRPPRLTDAELVKIRAMLEEFQLVCHSCPIARRSLDDENGN